MWTHIIDASKEGNDTRRRRRRCTQPGRARLSSALSDISHTPRIGTISTMKPHTAVTAVPCRCGQQSRVTPTSRMAERYGPSSSSELDEDGATDHLRQDHDHPRESSTTSRDLHAIRGFQRQWPRLGPWRHRSGPLPSSASPMSAAIGRAPSPAHSAEVASSVR
jgi:hypothetical protein